METITQFVKKKINKIKKLEKPTERERVYKELIDDITFRWEVCNESFKTFEKVAQEIMTKQQWIDLMKETLHRNFRKSNWFKSMIGDGKYKDWVDAEIDIMREHIKKYKIINRQKKGDKNGLQ